KQAPRKVILILVAALICGVSGCVQPEFNPTPTVSESESLSDIIQLTRGFERAGEAYFSADMHWIIFQATPRGEKQYQMFVSPVEYREDSIKGIGAAIRISPENSRNTCGSFSPDGKT